MTRRAARPTFLLGAGSAVTRYGSMVKLQEGPGSVCTASEASTTRLFGSRAMQPKRTTHDFVCVVCAVPFTNARPNARYCGQLCRQTFYARRYQQATGRSVIENGVESAPLTSGTRGALSELLACADLMRRGFHVFRAVSPSCPCDLVVWGQNGTVLRIEVKSAGRNPSTGTILAATSKRNEFDVICYVLEGEVIYDPPVEQW